ncbi:hypothetical protein POTOM_044864 [Populus tomentosa]|uniref:Pentatricopeptide repeat-containing protein n=1 Tax=Populus tomentosa TaxID=118781 RepID=A0A8X7YG21_POPTO|nr:hypothetical protein POTOM_044864 [Populus tomentosa]
MPHPPQNRSFYNLLIQYADQQSLKKGQILHAHIIKIPYLSSCNYLANNLIKFYAKCGHLHGAKLVFENLIHKNVVSYNCLIHGLSHNASKGSTFVLELFRRMIANNILPDAHTFPGVLNLGCNFDARQVHVLVGCVFEARKLFDRMPDRNFVSWTTMISGYASKQIAKEALGVLGLMRLVEGNLNEFVFTSVLSALRVQNLLIVESSDKNAMTWLADVVRVRRMMKVRGVRKETGCSWIELKSHVHVFVVGDQIHPQIEEIRGAIWRLRKHMKDDGYRPGHDSASVSV